jgi:hypothetical protein
VLFNGTIYDSGTVMDRHMQAVAAGAMAFAEPMVCDFRGELRLSFRLHHDRLAHARRGLRKPVAKAKNGIELMTI